ncbi:MAG: hypothetical protein K6F82_02525 [Sphaerochaetaceae bacterium]|nr:hypothetical protein [Sphaerochaetaceae bacterium]
MEVLDYCHSIAGSYVKTFTDPFDSLASLSSFILKTGERLPDSYRKVKENVWIHESASVAESSSINGPCIIDEGAEIRHCAFIRGCAVIGKNAVVGNSTEVKNSIIFDGVEIPHFNYVGDSILGYKSHFGAGVVTANVRLDKKNASESSYKRGALVGDYAQVGCNSVLSPGVRIGRNAMVYPLTLVREDVPSDYILKNNGTGVPVIKGE